MPNYVVNDTQLTVYLIFTLLSILISALFYCAYQHCLGLSQKDHQTFTKFYIEVARTNPQSG